MPIAAYGGATASRKMPAVIRRITSDSAALRPARSAYSPNTMPPIGRMKNATPNVAVVSSSDEYSLEVGKNSSAITTVMKPNTVKSYHSSALPITAAATARRFSARSGRLVFVEFAIVAMRASSSSSSPCRAARRAGCPRAGVQRV